MSEIFDVPLASRLLYTLMSFGSWKISCRNCFPILCLRYVLKKNLAIYMARPFLVKIRYVFARTSISEHALRTDETD